MTFPREWLFPVCLKMSTFRVRCALQFYNFHSILNLKLKNENFEVSKIVTISNLLKFPACIIISILVSFPSETQLLNDEIAIVKSSKFVTVSQIVVVFFHFFYFTLLCLIQILNRHKTMKLVNKAFELKMKKEFQYQFIKNCARHFLNLFLILVVLSIFQYCFIFKLSWQSAILMIIGIHQNLIILGFVTFSKNFEEFVVALLNELRSDLKLKLHENNQIYLKRHQEVYDLAEQFQTCFGLQFTVFTCFFTFNCIFSVSMNSKFNF